MEEGNANSCPPYGQRTKRQQTQEKLSERVPLLRQPQHEQRTATSPMGAVTVCPPTEAKSSSIPTGPKAGGKAETALKTLSSSVEAKDNASKLQTNVTTEAEGLSNSAIERVIQQGLQGCGLSNETLVKDWNDMSRSSSSISVLLDDLNPVGLDKLFINSQEPTTRSDLPVQTKSASSLESQQLVHLPDTVFGFAVQHPSVLEQPKPRKEHTWEPYANTAPVHDVHGREFGIIRKETLGSDASKTLSVDVTPTGPPIGNQMQPEGQGVLHPSPSTPRQPAHSRAGSVESCFPHASPLSTPILLSPSSWVPTHLPTTDLPAPGSPIPDSNASPLGTSLFRPVYQTPLASAETAMRRRLLHITNIDDQLNLNAIRFDLDKTYPGRVVGNFPSPKAHQGKSELRVLYALPTDAELAAKAIHGLTLGGRSPVAATICLYYSRSQVLYESELA